MLKRFEYKYKVPNVLLDPIRKEIQPFLDIDPFANKQKNSEYIVRSIYLDNLQFKSYHEKIEGLPYRNKFRIRGYNELSEDSMVFLEIKRKYLNNIAKTRIQLPFNNISYILNAGWPSLNTEMIPEYDRHNLKSFLYYFYRDRLQPVILIEYIREAWTAISDHCLRLTFDKKIRSFLMPEYTDLFKSEEYFLPAIKDFFVLEIKFSNTVPIWFKQVVRKYNLNRSSISKYTICIDTHLKKRPGYVNKFVNPKPLYNRRLPVLMLRNI